LGYDARKSLLKLPFLPLFLDPAQHFYIQKAGLIGVCGEYEIQKITRCGRNPNSAAENRAIKTGCKRALETRRIGEGTRKRNRPITARSQPNEADAKRFAGIENVKMKERTRV
jgi:hypothetical protein